MNINNKRDFEKLADVEYFPVLPVIENAIAINASDWAVSQIEWSDEQACLLYIFFQFESQKYIYFVECLDDTFRCATEDEISRYLALEAKGVTLETAGGQVFSTDLTWNDFVLAA